MRFLYFCTKGSRKKKCRYFFSAPPLELSGNRHFFLVLKLPKTDFDIKLPKNVWTKIAIFLPNIATNLLKSTTLPNDYIIYQELKIVKVKYVLLSIGNQKKSFKKGSGLPPPLSVVRPLKKDFFFLAASLRDSNIIPNFFL